MLSRLLHAALITRTPIAAQTPSVSIGLAPGIISAIITAVGALVVALIAAGCAIYQTRHSHQADRELERLRHKLDKQDRQEEEEESRREAARHEMVKSQTDAARAIAYRKALHVDPQISHFQIFDMQHPLGIANIYVRVRVYEDPMMQYAIAPVLSTAAQQRDPDSFFQARHRYLEQRVSNSIAPDVAIRKYRRCVVVGDPGAGKTTLLKYLALALVDGKYPDLPDLPIHIELNAFVYSEEQDLLSYAARRWQERYKFPKEKARNYMDIMLSDGKAILLLDALDETVVGEQSSQADTSYQKAWDAIMHLAVRYSQACIVVTARKVGYQQHRQLDGFTIVEVMDFRKEDIYQFVTNCFHYRQR